MTEPGATCSHGVAWTDECPDCDLVWAKQIIEHWARPVADAQKVVDEAERAQTQ